MAVYNIVYSVRGSRVDRLTKCKSFRDATINAATNINNRPSLRDGIIVSIKEHV